MIVFNLSCSQEHKFDGWFRSAEDFERQAAGGLVECPICGDSSITRHLSAPRINTGATEIVARPQTVAQRPAGSHGGVDAARLQEHMMQQFKAFVRANTEDVGSAFAETARKIHYGEESRRNIRGRVSRDEAIELHEEGIETVTLPPGIMLDESLQ
jgi:hypothetical protein